MEMVSVSVPCYTAANPSDVILSRYPGSSFQLSNKSCSSLPCAVVDAIEAHDADVGFGFDDDSDGDVDSQTQRQKSTITWFQSFLHLVKGNIGPGCLSLPWAVSQLGIGPGCVAVAIMSFWSSYNCWTVVRLKRCITIMSDVQVEDISDDELEFYTNTNTKAQVEERPGRAHKYDMTYPQLAGRLCGRRVERLLSVCISIQQLSICTVFLSFVGTNLQAVLLAFFQINLSHAQVITVFLPIVACLSLLPNLKRLAPVMAMGTLLFLAALLLLFCVMVLEAQHDHTSPQSTPKTPLTGLCAILYSFEGICLILPVESSMAQPKHYFHVFVMAMIIVVMVLSATAALSVATFGNVTSGSITAFLLQDYDLKSPYSKDILLVANAAVSLSVLMTFPLQLFPCLELLKDWTPGLFCKHIRRSMSICSGGYTPAQDIAAEQTSSNTNSNGFIDSGDRRGVHREIDSRPLPHIPNDASWTIRILLVGFTYALAIVVPNVQAMISLAGALSGSSTALVMPPILQLAYNYSQNNNKPCYVSCVLFIGGIFFLVVGTVASLRDIARIYLGS